VWILIGAGVISVAAWAGQLSPPPGPVTPTSPSLADLEAQIAQLAGADGASTGTSYAGGTFDLSLGGNLQVALISGPAIIHWVRISGPQASLDLRETDGSFIGRYGVLAPSNPSDRLELGIIVDAGFEAGIVSTSGTFFYTIGYTPLN